MSTSTEALLFMETTGARKTHCLAVFTALVSNPGLIASELAQITGYDPVETRRRLTDLKKQNKAYQAHTETGPSGRREQRWWPALQQGSLL